MNNAVHMSPVSLWHHRVLGGLWTICGLGFIGNLLRHYSWSEGQTWIAVFVGALYITAGVGLVFGRKWSQWMMGVLVVIAGLFFADMLLMSVWVGNRYGVWAMLAALGIAGYTLLFLVISAVDRCKDSQ